MTATRSLTALSFYVLAGVALLGSAQFLVCAKTIESPSPGVASGHQLLRSKDSFSSFVERGEDVPEQTQTETSPSKSEAVNRRINQFKLVACQSGTYGAKNNCAECAAAQCAYCQHTAGGICVNTAKKEFCRKDIKPAKSEIASDTDDTIFDVTGGCPADIMKPATGEKSLAEEVAKAQGYDF